MSDDVQTEDPRFIPYGRLHHRRGQKWVTDDDVEACEYAGVLGEVVRVRRLLGDFVFYELAAKVSPVRAGVPSADSPVWWLVPIATEVTAPELEAAVSSTAEGGNA